MSWTREAIEKYKSEASAKAPKTGILFRWNDALESILFYIGLIAFLGTVLFLLGAALWFVWDIVRSEQCPAPTDAVTAWGVFISHRLLFWGLVMLAPWSIAKPLFVGKWLYGPATWTARTIRNNSFLGFLPGGEPLDAVVDAQRQGNEIQVWELRQRQLRIKGTVDGIGGRYETLASVLEIDKKPICAWEDEGHIVQPPTAEIAT